jgi:hypothetical protein
MDTVLITVKVDEISGGKSVRIQLRPLKLFDLRHDLFFFQNLEDFFLGFGGG